MTFHANLHAIRHDAVLTDVVTTGPVLREKSAVRLRPVLTALVVACLAAGCSTLRTPYNAPELALPSAWSAPVSSASASNNNAAEMDSTKMRNASLQSAWWAGFADPQLNQLIELALQNNADMVNAAWNIQQARITLGLADDRAIPSLSAGASSSGSRNFDSGTSNRNHSVNVSVGYELDLWGKIASQRDAAQWRLNATEWDLQATALSLVSNVATTYWQLAYQNEQLRNAQESLAHVRRTQALVQAQYDAGSVSGLELQEARRSVASQEASLAQIQQTRAVTRNALAVLLGQAPSTSTWPTLVAQEPVALPDQALPDVPAGIPAQVLQRRPDLQAAQARLQGTLADGDAVRASYYPSMNLTAGLGSASSSLGNLLSNPVGSLAASLSLPFLQQTEMRLNKAASRATYEQAVVNFQQTLLVALQEVEDALQTREQLSEQQHWLHEQLDASQKAEQINEVRYRAGAVPLKNWLDAQEARRSAQLALSANRLSRLQAQLSLYKALGGDTEVTAPVLPDIGLATALK